jgi:2-dehydro-3-deoxygluconokinase
MTKKVITFGESLLRLSPPGHERFLQSSHFVATFGGAEANVAVALASFGMGTAYITVLPENNPMADAAIAELRRFGVDTSYIVRSKGRLGIYFLETGANQRASRVVYDREHSAMADATPGSIDWQRAFDGGAWFHISGITPAISASAAELTLESMRQARESGLTISFDLNYRRNLWKWGKKPETVMSDMVRAADLVIANEEHLQMLLGLTSPIDAKDLTSKVLTVYDNLQAVGVSLRDSLSASHNGFAACLNDRKEFATSRKYEITHIVDRIGAGDAFAAGLIYGWMNLPTHREALDFAVAAGCLKHSIPGDFCRVTVDEVNALRNEDRSGRVQR